eukprot:379228_1
MSLAEPVQNILTDAISGSGHLPTSVLDQLYNQAVPIFFNDGHSQTSINYVQGITLKILQENDIKDVIIEYDNRYLIRNMETAKKNWTGQFCNYNDWIKQQRTKMAQCGGS